MEQKFKFTNVKIDQFFTSSRALEIAPGEWCAGRCTIQGKSEKFAVDPNGNVSGIKVGKRYNIEAVKESNKYGNQWKITMIQPNIDLSTKEACLSTLSFITSERNAEKIWDHFEGNSDKIESALSDRKNGAKEIAKIPRINEEKAHQIVMEFITNLKGSIALKSLVPLGIPLKVAQELLEIHDNNEAKLMKVIREDPYSLYLDGSVSFNVIDKVFLGALGGYSNDLRRVASKLYYFFIETLRVTGHSYITIQQLNEGITEQSVGISRGLQQEIPGADIQEALDYLLESDLLIRKGTKYSTKRVHDTEELILKRLKKLSTSKSYVSPDSIIKAKIRSLDIELTDEQIAAVEVATKNNISIISGNAGSGKSTILKTIADIYAAQGYKISQVALSGKAALRIQETTGRKAQTIHRWVRSFQPTEEGAPQPLLNLENPFVDLRSVHFNDEVLIIDESSMLGASIMANVIRICFQNTALRHLVIVGDNAQLPPIGIGQAFNDLLENEALPTVKLTKVFRQALDSGTLAAATDIREGRSFLNNTTTPHELLGVEKDFEYYSTCNSELRWKSFIEHMAKNENNIMKVQFLAPTRNTQSAINLEIQSRLGIKSDLALTYFHKGRKHNIYIGDKVILERNCYKPVLGDAVFNGMIGIVKEIKPEDQYEDGEGTSRKGVVIIDFEESGEVSLGFKDAEGLTLGYCISVHKSQGSGFESVIIVINGNDKSSKLMLHSNLLYTALTRTKNYCTLMTQNFVVEHCSRNKANEKQTWLKEWIS